MVRCLNILICRVAGVDCRPGRVCFLTLLEPLAGDDRTVALAARSASIHRPSR